MIEQSMCLGGVKCTTCQSLRSIPEGLCLLTSLKKLEMQDCEALEDLPP